jgi:thiol-disulfide isomerase/thioredoxin
MSNTWIYKNKLVIALFILILVTSVIFLIVITPGSPLKPDNKVHVVYFYRPSCGTCDDTSKELERINQSYPGRLEITKIDITIPVDAETYQLYTYYLKKFESVTPGDVPWVIVDDKKDFEGYNSVKTNLEGIVNGSITLD